MGGAAREGHDAPGRPGRRVRVCGRRRSRTRRRGYPAWRRRWESNPRSGFCRPVPYHLATSPRDLECAIVAEEPASTSSLTPRRGRSQARAHGATCAFWRDRQYCDHVARGRRKGIGFEQGVRYVDDVERCSPSAARWHGCNLRSCLRDDCAGSSPGAGRRTRDRPPLRQGESGVVVLTAHHLGCIGECECFRAGEVVRLTGVAMTKQRRESTAPGIIAIDGGEPAIAGESGTATAQDE